MEKLTVSQLPKDFLAVFKTLKGFFTTLNSPVMNIRIHSTILHSVTLRCILLPSFRVHFGRQIGLFS